MSSIIFPGSFDPITIGHVNLIKRAVAIFDEVNIVVVNNPYKKCLFTVDQRVTMIKKVASQIDGNISVDSHSGLIIDYCQDKQKFLLLRGLRNSTDLSYEHNMSIHNTILNEKIETICLLTHEGDFHISSSAVRELLLFGASVNHLVPKIILEDIKNADL